MNWLLIKSNNVGDSLWVDPPITHHLYEVMYESVRVERGGWVGAIEGHNGMNPTVRFLSLQQIFIAT